MGLLDFLSGLVATDEDEGDADGEGEGGSRSDAGPTYDVADLREQADRLVREAPLDLDYSVESLDRLDDGVGGRGGNTEATLACGGYFGEVLVRQYDGEWVYDGGWAVAIDRGDETTTVPVVAAAERTLSGEPVFAEIAGLLDEEGGSGGPAGADTPADETDTDDGPAGDAEDADADGETPGAEPAGDTAADTAAEADAAVESADGDEPADPDEVARLETGIDAGDERTGDTDAATEGAPVSDDESAGPDASAAASATAEADAEDEDAADAVADGDASPVTESDESAGTDGSPTTPDVDDEGSASADSDPVDRSEAVLGDNRPDRSDVIPSTADAGHEGDDPVVAGADDEGGEPAATTASDTPDVDADVYPNFVAAETADVDVDTGVYPSFVTTETADISVDDSVYPTFVAAETAAVDVDDSVYPTFVAAETAAVDVGDSVYPAFVTPSVSTPEVDDDVHPEFVAPEEGTAVMTGREVAESSDDGDEPVAGSTAEPSAGDTTAETGATVDDTLVADAASAGDDQPAEAPASPAAERGDGATTEADASPNAGAAATGDRPTAEAATAADERGDGEQSASTPDLLAAVNALNGTPASLQELDRLVAEANETEDDAPDPDAEARSWLAAYYGDVLCAHLGGERRAAESDSATAGATDTVVVLPRTSGRPLVVDCEEVARASQSGVQFAVHFDGLADLLDRDVAATDAPVEVVHTGVLARRVAAADSSDAIADLVADAAAFADARPAFDLDYSPASLARLDDLFSIGRDIQAIPGVSLGTGQAGTMPLVTAPVADAAAYFAAVLVRHLDGLWRSGDGVAVHVYGRHGNATVDALAAAVDCVQGRDTFADRYDAVRTVLGAD